MPKGKVEKLTWFSEWEYQGKVNHNFVVKFVGSEDRFVYVGRDKANPQFKEGVEMDYKLDGRKIKGNIGTHQFEYEKISPVQQQGGGFGGGGGGKSYVKSPDQIKNELVSFAGGYSAQILCHRINLGKDATDIVKEFETLSDGIVKALTKHIK